MKEQFETFNFQRKTRDLIRQANSIIDELRAEGYTLTVRQLYYQFVSRGLLENKQTNYQRLASVIDDGRKAGLIDWEAIEDRTRYLRRITTYTDPATFLRQQTKYYWAQDLWRDQDVYCEVWVEKDALLGVIEQPCLEWRVPYFACRGYASSSELYKAGKRFKRQAANGKRGIIFHLGDHDPSGIDMTRVNDDSVQTFSDYAEVEVRRLALNMDQIEQYDPPPNPAKESDSRFEAYAAEHGEQSWELDALSPAVLDQLIRDAIEGVVDEERFDAAREIEDGMKAELNNIASAWEAVSRYLKHRHTEAEVEVRDGIRNITGLFTPDDIIERIEGNEHDDEH